MNDKDVIIHDKPTEKLFSFRQLKNLLAQMLLIFGAKDGNQLKTSSLAKLGRFD